MRLLISSHNMWVGISVDIEMPYVRCESRENLTGCRKAHVMSIKRFAFCFTVLLAFSTVYASPASADLITEIKKGARKTGTAIKRGARKVGSAIEEGVEDTGVALKRGGRTLHRGFCDTFTDKSDAQCRAESGVGYDKKGTYTYDPKNPK